MTAVVLRTVSKHDHASVFSDWLHSGRRSPAYARIPNEVYFYWQHRIIETLLAEPTAAWLVACDPNDQTRIYGWACAQRAESVAGDQVVVHYIYVKKPYRRVGIASRLLSALESNSAALVVTHLSDAGRELLGTRVYVYNPFLVWARTPAVVGEGSAPPARLSVRNPIAVSRRALASGGFVPGTDEVSDEGA